MRKISEKTAILLEKHGNVSFYRENPLFNSWFQAHQLRPAVSQLPENLFIYTLFLKYGQKQ